MEVTQPVIETQRLILEPFKESDISDIFEYAADPELTKYLLWDAHQSVEDSKKFFEWIKTSTSLRVGELFFVFAIRHKENGRVVGTIDFKNPNKFCGQTDYAIARKYWNMGLMTEAAVAIRDWAFSSFPEMVRFQAYCQPENIGSRRVMEKLAMEFEGIRRKAFIVKNRPVDLAYYAIVKA